MNLSEFVLIGSSSAKAPVFCAQNKHRVGFVLLMFDYCWDRGEEEEEVGEGRGGEGGLCVTRRDLMSQLLGRKNT